MKRKPNSHKYHHRWKRKLLVVLLLVFCFATFVVMESQYNSIKMLTLVSLPLQKPKIAFLFIARNRIPLDMVWDVFFQVIWLLLPYFGFITFIEIDHNSFNCIYRSVVWWFATVTQRISFLLRIHMESVKIRRSYC